MNQRKTRRSIGTAIAGLAVLLLVAVAVCWIDYQRQMSIDTGHGIAEAGFVTLGGLPQYVQIRGRDRANPVLLLLNGGPGFTMLPSTYNFRRWEEEYTLVMWDYRGEGKTYERSGPGAQGTMSLDRIARDGVELADYLRGKLPGTRVVVVGHSFGALLGVHMVRLQPESFAAYVGTGQLVDQQRGAAASYPLLIERAQDLGNDQALADLRRAGPPPYGGGVSEWIPLLVWAQSLDPPGAEKLPARPGNLWNRARLYAQRWLGPTEVAPGVTAATQFAMFSLWPDILSRDLAETGRDFRMPVVIIQGTEDLSTATSVAKHYFDLIEAPSKQYVSREGRGHLTMYREPMAFLDALNRHVRQFAVAAD
jgi:pimeloyl-ACP methyl ester carboxylesterase